jgi:hypothetical protein
MGWTISSVSADSGVITDGMIFRRRMGGKESQPDHHLSTSAFLTKKITQESTDQSPRVIFRLLKVSRRTYLHGEKKDLVDSHRPLVSNMTQAVQNNDQNDGRCSILLSMSFLCMSTCFL